jgi:diadenosine tetraphosphate (Ap4A) HIT family hydrolase
MKTSSQVKLLTREEYSKKVAPYAPTYCPFCDKENKQIVITKTKKWVMILNLAPYWKHHILIYPKRHIEKLDDINVEDFKEIKKLYKGALTRYKAKKIKHSVNKKLVDQYILFFRYRDTTKKISTEYKPAHLHIHIAPDVEGLYNMIIDKNAHRIDVEDFLS